MANSMVREDPLKEVGLPPSWQQPEGAMDDQLVVLTVLTTMAAFFLLNEAVRHGSRRYVILHVMSEHRFRNLAVSWIHADLVSVWILYCWFTYKHQIGSVTDLLHLNPPSAYLLVAFSTGYFLYDFIDFIREGIVLKQWEVTLHHIAVLVIFLYHLVHHMALGFVVLALVVELNSVFLHGRKLLQMCHVPFRHPGYRLVAACNLLTFALFRGGPLTLIWVAIARVGHLFSRGYLLVLSTVMVFMVLLNAGFFWRLLCSDVLRRPGVKGKAKAKAKASVEGEVEKEEEEEGKKARGGMGKAPSPGVSDRDRGVVEMDKAEKEVTSRNGVVRRTRDSS